MAKRWMKGVLATDNVVRNDTFQWVTFWKGCELRDLVLKPNGYWERPGKPYVALTFRNRREFRNRYKGVIPPAPGEAFEVELEV